MKNWQQRHREMGGYSWQKQQEQFRGEREDFSHKRSSKWLTNLIWLIIVGGFIAYLFGALK